MKITFEDAMRRRGYSISVDGELSKHFDSTEMTYDELQEVIKKDIDAALKEEETGEILH